MRAPDQYQMDEEFSDPNPYRKVGSQNDVIDYLND